MWHYVRANVDQIRQATIEFPGDNRLTNINVNEQVQLFTETIQNIIFNYIPHETITCGDRNPPRIDEKIKKLVRHKYRVMDMRILEIKIMLIFFINFNLLKHI